MAVAGIDDAVFSLFVTELTRAAPEWSDQNDRSIE